MVNKRTGLSRPGSSDLRDERRGAFDNVVPRPRHPGAMHSTKRESDQHGADVRPQTEPNDESTPLGLRRRKGPLNPSSGRAFPDKRKRGSRASPADGQ